METKYLVTHSDITLLKDTRKDAESLAKALVSSYNPEAIIEEIQVIARKPIAKVTHMVVTELAVEEIK